MPDQIKLASLAAFAQELELPIGLVLTEVEVQTGPALFEDMKFEVVDPGNVTVRVSPDSLQAFIATKLPPMIRDLKISLKNGLIHATATAKVVVEVTATAMLRPVIFEEKELRLEVVDFEGPGVARGIMEKQIENQNPVFKTADLPFPLLLNRVEVSDQLIVEGTWSLPPN